MEIKEKKSNTIKISVVFLLFKIDYCSFGKSKLKCITT
jgi:hypothetical protein